MSDEAGYYLELSGDLEVVGEVIPAQPDPNNQYQAEVLVDAADSLELLVSVDSVTVELPLTDWLEIDDFRGPPGPKGDPGPAGGTAPYVEIPSGSMDGVNEVFHTAVPYLTGTTRVFLNGLRNFAGINYTESGGNVLTLSFAPIAGDLLIVEYQQG